ncbi:MAG: hypothetical protein AMXMBFR81_18810 [Chthonomonas sp.]
MVASFAPTLPIMLGKGRMLNVMTHLKTALALAALGIGALAMPQAKPLKRTHAPGDSAAYRYELKIGGATHAGTMSQTVSRIEADGSYVLESKTDGGAASSGVYMANGVVKELLGPDVNVAAYRIAFMTMFQSPPAPVQAEDFWTFETRMNPVTGARAVRVVYRVEAIESLGTVETMRIRFSMTETDAPNPATSDGTIWVDTATGWVAKSQFIWRNAPIGPNGEGMDATLTMVKEGLAS